MARTPWELDNGHALDYTRWLITAQRRTRLKHSIEDLAERADDHGDGYFYVLRHGDDEIPEGGRWEASMRDRDGDRITSGHGSTPDLAVQDLLDRQEHPSS